MKLFPLIIAGLLLFCGIVSAQPVMFEKYEFQLLQSRVEFSQNRRYVFVRVPTMPIDQYEREVVRELLAAGRTKKEIANFQHSKRYSDALRAERESRIAYPETGLYDAVSGSLLKRFPDFPIECERIFVSDSGAYIVAVNVQVLSDKQLDGDTPMATLRQIPQPGIFVGWAKPDKRSCLLPLSALITDSDVPSISTVGFKWARDEDVFDDSGKTISLTKLNQNKLTFDITACSLAAENQVSATQPDPRSSCWAALMLFVAVLVSTPRSAV